jgi:hypothetical protein
MSAAAIVQRSDRFHEAASVVVVVVNRSMMSQRSKEVAIAAVAPDDGVIVAKIAAVLRFGGSKTTGRRVSDYGPGSHFRR